MPDSGFIFNQEAARNVLKASERVLGVGDLSGANIGNQTTGLQCIFAALLSRDGTDLTKYAWAQRRRTNTGYEAVTNGLSGTTTSNPAYNIHSDSETDLTGTYVMLVRSVIRADDSSIKPCWIIIPIEEIGNPQYQYMGLYGVASNQRGWTFLKAHPLET